jgi:hypothetical protein
MHSKEKSSHTTRSKRPIENGFAALLPRRFCLHALVSNTSTITHHRNPTQSSETLSFSLTRSSPAPNPTGKRNRQDYPSFSSTTHHQIMSGAGGGGYGNYGAGAGGGGGEMGGGLGGGAGGGMARSEVTGVTYLCGGTSGGVEQGRGRERE